MLQADGQDLLVAVRQQPGHHLGVDRAGRLQQAVFVAQQAQIQAVAQVVIGPVEFQALAQDHRLDHPPHPGFAQAFQQ